MSVNSSFADASHLPSNLSLYSPNCLTFTTSFLTLTAFFITNILLIVPLATFIFYLWYQRMRQHCFVSTTKAATSHSDIFTYHILAMEMIVVLGYVLYCVGVKTDLENTLIYGFNILFSTWCVKIAFHTLTCLERYLAVVHPVTYLGLKNKSGVRIRNISVGCVWLLCFVWCFFLTITNFRVNIIMHFCLLAFAICVICFCCISVLCALRRPAPGEAARDRERMNQMKQRAFNTVVIIMGLLWLCLGGMLVGISFVDAKLLNDRDECAVLLSGFWFSLPSSLVLPVLYLHRAGKLPGCKPSTN